MACIYAVNLHKIAMKYVDKINEFQSSFLTCSKECDFNTKYLTDIDSQQQKILRKFYL